MGLHLYRLVIILSVWVCVLGVTPISIGHIPISLCSVELGKHLYRLVIVLLVCVFESGSHLYRSVIILSVWVCVLGATPISIGHISISLCSVWVGAAPISIDHLPISLSLSFSSWGPHLYRSTIFLSVWVWVLELRTYIDRSFLCQFEFSGLHLYRSAIFLSVWVWVFKLRTTPISIDHFCVSLTFWGRTYIDRPSSYQFEFEFFKLGTAPISISYFRVSLSFWGCTYIDRSSSC